MLTQFRRACSILGSAARRKLFVLLGFLLGNTLMELIGVVFIIQLLRLIENPSRVLSSPKLKTLYDMLGFADPRDFLLAASLGFLGLFLLKNVFYLAFTNYQARFICIEGAAMSKRLYSHYLHSPYMLHLRRNSADLIMMVDQTVRLLFYRVLAGYVSLAAETFVIVGIVAILLIVEPLITLAVGVTLGACFVLFFSLLKNRSIALGAADLRSTRLYQQALREGLNSIKEAKVSGREDYFVSAFDKPYREYSHISWLRTVLNALPRIVIESVVVGGIVAVMCIILIQQRETGDIVIVLGLFTMAAFRIIPSVNRTIFSFTNILQGRSAVDLLYEDARTLVPSARTETPGAAEFTSGDFRFTDRIAVETVSFSYPDGSRAALSNVSFAIRRGESIGIVGPSGGGKSTLIDIMLGLLAPDAGRILVDGRDIAGHMRAWRTMIGYVPQAVSLPDATLRNNVAFGMPESDIDDAQVWKALRMAHLELFVRGLPEGLDTIVGENGVRLSGGQRQRIGIARALYHDSAVLFMDEATSSLDSETEREITAAIGSLRGDKTLVIIAHRLSTVRGCDRLILIKDGRVADVGSFDDLLSRNADFVRMVDLAALAAEAPKTLQTIE